MCGEQGETIARMHGALAPSFARHNIMWVVQNKKNGDKGIVHIGTSAQPLPHSTLQQPSPSPTPSTRPCNCNSSPPAPLVALLSSSCFPMLRLTVYTLRVRAPSEIELNNATTTCAPGCGSHYPGELLGLYSTPSHDLKNGF